MKKFKYNEMKDSINPYHLFLPTSHRLKIFLACDGDLSHWALQRWTESYKIYLACKLIIDRN